MTTLPTESSPSAILTKWKQQNNYYALFNLTAKQTLTEQDLKDLKQEYHKLALVNHPDKHPEATKEYEEIFKYLANAYETLLDPTRRAQHLEKLLSSLKPSTGTLSHSSSRDDKKKRKHGIAAPSFSEFQSFISDEQNRKKHADRIIAFIEQNPNWAIAHCISYTSITGANIFMDSLRDLDFKAASPLYKALIAHIRKGPDPSVPVPATPEILLSIPAFNPFNAILNMQNLDDAQCLAKVSTLIQLFLSFHKNDVNAVRNKIIPLLQSALLSLPCPPKDIAKDPTYNKAYRALCFVFSQTLQTLTSDPGFNSDILRALSKIAELRFNSLNLVPLAQRKFRLVALFSLREDLWDREDLAKSEEIFKDLVHTDFQPFETKEKYFSIFIRLLDHKQPGSSLALLSGYVKTLLAEDTSIEKKKKLLLEIKNLVAEGYYRISSFYKTVKLHPQQYQDLLGILATEEAKLTLGSRISSGGSREKKGKGKRRVDTFESSDFKKFAPSIFSPEPPPLPKTIFSPQQSTAPVSPSGFFSRPIKSESTVGDTATRSTAKPSDLDLSFEALGDKPPTPTISPASAHFPKKMKSESPVGDTKSRSTEKPSDLDLDGFEALGDELFGGNTNSDLGDLDELFKPAETSNPF